MPILPWCRTVSTNGKGPVKKPAIGEGPSSVMQAKTRRASRIAATLALVGLHLYLTIIGTFDRLNYTVPTRYRLIEEAADSEIWVGIHLTIAVSLLVGLWHNRGWEWRACSVSAGFMGAWAFFNLLWGLSVVSPVSLAAPGLAAFAAFGAHVLGLGWLRANEEHHYRER